MEDDLSYIFGGFDGHHDDHGHFRFAFAGGVSITRSIDSTSTAASAVEPETPMNQILERLRLVEAQVSSCLETQPLLYKLICNFNGLSRNLKALKKEVDEIRVSPLTASSSVAALFGDGVIFQELAPETEIVSEGDNLHKSQQAEVDVVKDDADKSKADKVTETGAQRFANSATCSTSADDLVLQLTTQPTPVSETVHQNTRSTTPGTSPRISAVDNEASSATSTISNHITSISKHKVAKNKRLTSSSDSNPTRLNVNRTKSVPASSPSPLPSTQVVTITDRHICDECGVALKSVSYLSVHKLEVHQGKNRAPCPECGKLVLKRDLRRHLRTHTGERPHACPHCPMKFACRSNLKSHEYTHTGRPHKCDKCQRRFSTPYILKLHQKAVHSEPFVFVNK